MSPALLALFACSGDDDPVTVTLDDPNNYNFVGDLAVPVLPTRASGDVEVRWDALVSDMQCHAMDPAADIDNAAMIRFARKDQPTVELGMEHDTLQQADVDGYIEVNTTDATSAHLDDMSFFGTDIDLETEFTEDGGTYLLLLTTGIETGVGARMVAFLEPHADSDIAAVDVPNGCGILDLDVDLDSLTPVSVPAEGPWRFDWTDVTETGQGDLRATGAVDALTIARYETWTTADLETNFLDVEVAATEIWTWQLDGGDDMLLDPKATDAPDFSAPGLWILALRCNACYNPAPIFLTILQPEASG